MQFPLYTLVAAATGHASWGQVVGRERRSGRGRPRSIPFHGADAPLLNTRWVVLVENGVAVAPPSPCLFDETLAPLEAATAMHGARPGVTARVGTMRRLLSLELGLRAEDFHSREPRPGEAPPVPENGR